MRISLTLLNHVSYPFIADRICMQKLRYLFRRRPDVFKHVISSFPHITPPARDFRLSYQRRVSSCAPLNLSKAFEILLVLYDSFSQAIKTQIHRNSNSRSRHTRPLFHLLVMPVAVSSDPDHWIAHVRLFSCRNVQISLYTTRHLVPLPSRSPIRILLSSTPLFHALPGLFSLTSTFPRSDNANTSPNDK